MTTRRDVLAKSVWRSDKSMLPPVRAGFIRVIEDENEARERDREQRDR